MPQRLPDLARLHPASPDLAQPRPTSPDLTLSVWLGVVGCGWVWLGVAGCGWVWLGQTVVRGCVSGSGDLFSFSSLLCFIIVKGSTGYVRISAVCAAASVLGIFGFAALSVLVYVRHALFLALFVYMYEMQRCDPMGHKKTCCRSDLQAVPPRFQKLLTRFRKAGEHRENHK